MVANFNVRTKYSIVEKKDGREYSIAIFIVPMEKRRAGTNFICKKTYYYRNNY